MTAGQDWSVAFPLLLHEVERAVEAVVLAWDQLAAVPTKGFNPTRKEPELTRVLKDWVDNVTAPQLGLRGMWATEPVINVVDPLTHEIKEERRLDIVYGWNDDGKNLRIRMVFEFKKITKYSKSRKSYLDHNGLMRFVNGLYSKGEPLAAMVGILMATEKQVIDPIRSELTAAGSLAKYAMHPGISGNGLYEPSQLFPSRALFDTHHTRPAHLAHPRGAIEVAHMFVKFG